VWSRAAATERRRGLRILVVEDDPDRRELMGRLITFAGPWPTSSARSSRSRSPMPPGELILTNYVRVRDGKIVEMYIVRVA
jgi:CheY-like chemotaxis protein